MRSSQVTTVSFLLLMNIRRYQIESNKIFVLVSHATSDEIYNGCWYNAYMPPRSLVINGKVTTIQSHTVLSTDLEDGSLEWSLNLDEDLGLSKEDCGSYFRYW